MAGYTGQITDVSENYLEIKVKENKTINNNEYAEYLKSKTVNKQIKLAELESMIFAKLREIDKTIHTKEAYKHISEYNNLCFKYHHLKIERIYTKNV